MVSGQPDWNRWWLVAATVAAVVAGVLGALQLRRGQFTVGFALLALSVCIVRWPRSIWPEQTAKPLSKRTRRLALLAVCAIGAFFRIH